MSLMRVMLHNTLPQMSVRFLSTNGYCTCSVHQMSKNGYLCCLQPSVLVC